MLLGMFSRINWDAYKALKSMVSPQLDVQIIDTIVFVIISYLYNMDNITNLV